MSSQKESIECCICMDAINFATNNCITPCGHTFCFQCLAKALEKNNTCPCCRAVLMEEDDRNDDDDDETIWSEFSDDIEDDEETLSEDEVLTGFRMFHQRLAGEEVEQDDEVSNSDENATDMDEEDGEPLAKVEDITAKLQSRGITIIDLVAMITGRKSTKIAKHTNRFINAFENIIEIAMIDCDREAKELIQRSQQPGASVVQIA